LNETAPRFMAGSQIQIAPRVTLGPIKQP